MLVLKTQLLPQCFSLKTGIFRSKCGLVKVGFHLIELFVY